MKKLTIILFFLVSLYGLYSCTTLQQMANIVNCDFRMKSLTDPKLAGVNIQSKNSLSAMSFSDVSKLTGAYLNKNIPLSFNLNIEAKNPNSQPAILNKFDWILTIDDIEMTSGTNTNQVNIQRYV